MQFPSFEEAAEAGCWEEPVLLSENLGHVKGCLELWVHPSQLPRSCSFRPLFLCINWAPFVRNHFCHYVRTFLKSFLCSVISRQSLSFDCTRSNTQQTSPPPSRSFISLPPALGWYRSPCSLEFYMSGALNTLILVLCSWASTSPNTASTPLRKQFLWFLYITLPWLLPLCPSISFSLVSRFPSTESNFEVKSCVGPWTLDELFLWGRVGFLFWHFLVKMLRPFQIGDAFSRWNVLSIGGFLLSALQLVYCLSSFGCSHFQEQTLEAEFVQRDY